MDDVDAGEWGGETRAAEGQQWPVWLDLLLFRFSQLKTGELARTETRLDMFVASSISLVVAGRYACL